MLPGVECGTGPQFFLVADDQAFIRGLVQGMLARLGAASVRCVGSGEAAREALLQRGTNFAAIICDWNMEPMSGLQLLRAIRMGQIETVPANFPFIMLTGFADSKLVTAAANLDVNAYLVKPVSSKRLNDALRVALTKPLSAKPVSFYERIELVAPPKTVQTEDPPGEWAQWVRAGRPVFLDQDTTYIRREGVKLDSAPANEAPSIRLIRFKRADRIEAGAVLVEDFCDADGAVLLNAGVVLSEKMLKQLRGMKTENGEPPRLWVGRL